MAGVVSWCFFVLCLPRFIHGVAGAGHLLGALLDAADDEGLFSRAQEGYEQQPSHTQTKINASPIWAITRHSKFHIAQGHTKVQMAGKFAQRAVPKPHQVHQGHPPIPLEPN